MHHDSLLVEKLEFPSVFEFIHSHPCSFPSSSRGMLACSCRLSTSCHGGWMQVSNSLIPHFKIRPFLHFIFAFPSSSSFSSTSPRVWQFPRLMCPPLCRHQAKMQALLWDVPQGSDLSRADKGVQVIYKKRHCFSVSWCLSQWDTDRFSWLCLLSLEELMATQREG